jgi:hypothetical protein
MPTLEEIKTQIQNIDGLSKFLRKKEIKELPNILWDNENVENLIDGIIDNLRGGILVATNKRLIFIDKELLYGLNVKDFPYDIVNSIQYTTGLIFGKLTIIVSGNKTIIENVDKQRFQIFSDFVKNKISSSQKETVQEPKSKLEQITTQIQNIDGLSKYLEKKEIKELPNILLDNENVENLINGTYNDSNGILVATNKRLIFINKGFLHGLNVTDFPYDIVSSIQYTTGLLFGKLTIFASGNKVVIENVDKQRVQIFSDFVKNKIPSNQKETVQEPESKSGGLVWIVIVIAAGGFFVWANRDKLGQKGGIVIVVAAIVIGIITANIIKKSR